jgi:excisionase family DNA binding protein
MISRLNGRFCEMAVQERNPDEEVETVPEAVTFVPPLMTPQEVADFLAVPVLTLQTWRAKRKGPRVYRVGRHVRYRRDDVEAWLEQEATPG